MMQKIKIYSIYFLLFLWLFLPSTVKAASSDVSFSCYDEVVLGTNLNCKIGTILNDSTIKGIQFNYEFDKAFSYVKTKSDNNWSLLSDNNEGVMAVKVSGTSRNENIVSVDFMVSNDAVVGNNYNFKIKNIVLSDGDKDISVEDKSFKVKIVSVFEIIESIKLNGNDITLKDGVNNYTFPIGDVESIDFSVKLKSDNYQLSGDITSDKVENLKPGDNHKVVKIMKNDVEVLNLNFNFIRENISDSEINIDENPKTGSTIFKVLFVLGVCILFIVYYSKKINLEVK